jgi:hypothetical protein
MTKPIIVVSPKAATSAVRQQLRRAGYVVVVSDDPNAFRVLDPVPLFPTNAVLEDALRIVRTDLFGPERFGKRTLDRMLAQFDEAKK